MPEGPDHVVAGVTAPLFACAHAPVAPAGSGPGGFFCGRAIAGGTFHPGSGAGLANPFPGAFHGQCFFADFAVRFVGVLDAGNQAAYPFAHLGGSPVDLLVGRDGALYVLTRAAIVRSGAP